MEYRAPLTDDWFTAQVTDVYDGDTPTVYAALEVCVQANRSVSEKVGGRVISLLNPAVAVAGGPFAVGDIVLVRTAKNAGGLLWEMIPVDCCAWGADWYTARTPNPATYAGPTAIDSASGGSKLIAESLIKVPANSGRVEIRGGLRTHYSNSNLWSATGVYGSNRMVNVWARLVECTGAAVQTSTLSVYHLALVAGITTDAASYATQPMGWVGDITGDTSHAVMGDFARTTPIGTTVADSATDKYYAWQVAWVVAGYTASLWGGYLYWTGFGDGGCWLIWERACGQTDSVLPELATLPPRGMDMHAQSLTSVTARQQQSQRGLLPTDRMGAGNDPSKM